LLQALMILSFSTKIFRRFGNADVATKELILGTKAEKKSGAVKDCSPVQLLQEKLALVFPVEL
jgi:hypothetical protein